VRRVSHAGAEMSCDLVSHAVIQFCAGYQCRWTAAGPDGYRVEVYAHY
jgi:hypothetical protein